MADTPFNMSFDELMAQVSGGTTTPATQTETQTPQTAPSFEEMAAQATQTSQPASATQTEPLSFEEMVAQAQAKAKQAPAVDVPKVETPKEEPAQTPATPSFEDVVANAKAQIAEQTGESKAEEKAPATEVSKTETPVEETKAEEQTPVTEETKTENTTMEAPAEETKAEEKPKKARKKKAAKATEPVEVPEDKTAEYVVDINGTGKKVEEPVQADSNLDTLFTPEDVAAIRKDIRTFVRKEFKLAMVDAMKELLHDFAN